MIVLLVRNLMPDGLTEGACTLQQGDGLWVGSWKREWWQRWGRRVEILRYFHSFLSSLFYYLCNINTWTKLFVISYILKNYINYHRYKSIRAKLFRTDLSSLSSSSANQLFFSHIILWKILPIFTYLDFYRPRSSALYPTPIWSIRSLYLCPLVTGWTSYSSRKMFPFSSPSTTRRATVEVF
jgi:hypothetical protein